MLTYAKAQAANMQAHRDAVAATDARAMEMKQVFIASLQNGRGWEPFISPKVERGVKLAHQSFAVYKRQRCGIRLSLTLRATSK